MAKHPWINLNFSSWPLRDTQRGCAASRGVASAPTPSKFWLLDPPVASSIPPPSPPQILVLFEPNSAFFLPKPSPVGSSLPLFGRATKDFFYYYYFFSFPFKLFNFDTNKGIMWSHLQTISHISFPDKDLCLGLCLRRIMFHSWRLGVSSFQHNTYLFQNY